MKNKNTDIEWLQVNADFSSALDEKEAATVGLMNGMPDRRDLRVFYEQLPLPDVELDPASMLQVSIAKRKKKLTMEEPALFPVNSPSFASTLAGAAKAVVAQTKGGHEGAGKHKKNASPGHTSSSPKPGAGPSSIAIPTLLSDDHAAHTDSGSLKVIYFYYSNNTEE